MESQTGSSAVSSSSYTNSNAVSLLAAVAITVLIFVVATAVQITCWKQYCLRQRQERNAGISLRELLQQAVATRLFLAGVTALTILILQQKLWRQVDSDNDNSSRNASSHYRNSDLWTTFLYAGGVTVTVILIAVNHMVYWSYCESIRGPDGPCDETVAPSECDEEEEGDCFDEEEGLDKRQVTTDLELVEEQADETAVNEDVGVNSDQVLEGYESLNAPEPGTLRLGESTEE